MGVQTEDEFLLRSFDTSETFKSTLVKNLPIISVERINPLNGKIKVVEVLGDVLKYTSIRSPIGKKIQNKEIGEKIEVVIDSKKINYEIIAIT